MCIIWTIKCLLELIILCDYGYVFCEVETEFLEQCLHQYQEQSELFYQEFA